MIRFKRNFRKSCVVICPQVCPQVNSRDGKTTHFPMTTGYFGPGTAARSRHRGDDACSRVRQLWWPRRDEAEIRPPPRRACRGPGPGEGALCCGEPGGCRAEEGCDARAAGVPLAAGCHPACPAGETVEILGQGSELQPFLGTWRALLT